MIKVNAPCALIHRVLAVKVAASHAERLQMARARSSIALVTYRKRTHVYVLLLLSAMLLPTVSLDEASKRGGGLMK